jgi:hypothetical protein
MSPQKVPSSDSYAQDRNKCQRSRPFDRILRLVYKNCKSRAPSQRPSSPSRHIAPTNRATGLTGARRGRLKVPRR